MEWSSPDDAAVGTVGRRWSSVMRKTKRTVDWSASESGNAPIPGDDFGGRGDASLFLRQSLLQVAEEYASELERLGSARQLGPASPNVASAGW
jgi:hypothetical protein